MSQQSDQIEILKYAVELGREAERHKAHATQLAFITVCDRQNLAVPAPLLLNSATPYLGQQPVLNSSIAEPTKRAEPPGILDQLIQADRSGYYSGLAQPAAAVGGAIQAVASETAAETEQAVRSLWRKTRVYRNGLIIGIVLLTAWRLGWFGWLTATVTTRMKTLVPPTPPVAIESPSPNPTPTPSVSPSPLLPESPVPESSPSAAPSPVPSPVPPANPDQPSLEQMLEDVLKNNPAAS